MKKTAIRLAAAACMLAAGEARGESLGDDWEIRVFPGGSREYITTNKVATHFSCEAAGPHSRSYHGLYCSMFEYLDSWELALSSGPLKPGEIKYASAYPWALYRVYETAGVQEEIVLPDGLNGLWVSYSGLPGGSCSFVPWVDMRYIWDVPRPEYRIFWEKRNNLLLISRVDDPFGDRRPRWIAVTSDTELSFRPDEKFRPTEYPKDMARKAMGRTNPFSPGVLGFSPGEERSTAFAIGLGATEDEAAREARAILEGGAGLADEKRERLEGLISMSGAASGSGSGGEKALRWAMASMDDLLMRQRGRGIYAGFHWFPNYWGRDSFISLPGACLATGRLEDAREILTSFMAFQQKDRASARLGRLPNIVNPDDLQYAGVDGTWWFVRAAWKYFEAGADYAFLAEGWPALRRAVEGALEKAVDGEGFLTHGDGETWMDAGGERNPYSPRGDRAVEVQALFHHGLLAGASWARSLAGAVRDGRFESAAGMKSEEGAEDAVHGLPDPGSLEKTAREWTERAARLAAGFRERFVNRERGCLFDHLDRDGGADLQIRPNAVLALWVYMDTMKLPAALGQDGAIDPRLALVTESEFDTAVETAARTVMLPHGVTSLDPSDPDFHPLHLALDRYYYDEAYHNGDVWEWLSGPMISCLLATGRTAEARALFEPLVSEILGEACVGSLREIQDGRFTPGKEEFGGATSQAWSLAEFIRVAAEEKDLLR